MNKQLIESILKEEMLVAKLNQDILREHKKLVAERQDWYSLVAEEYMKLEKGDDFDSSVIEEGIWSKIKYYMGKAGSLEKGGKIFGRTKRTQAAADKLEAAIAKAAEKGFGNFKNNIEKDYPEFPNMENKEDFMNALQDVGAVYDSLDAAVGKGALDPVSANALVEALREYVTFLLDYKLADSYKHFNERQEKEEDLDEAVGAVASTKAPTRRTPARTGTAGGGGAPEDPDTPKGKFTKRGAQGDAADSETLKGLASNKLPAILGLTGAAATLAGLLVQSQWAIGLLTKAKAGGSAASGPVKTLTTNLTPKSGEGFTQMLGRITNGNPAQFGPNTPPADLFKAMSDIGVNPNNPAELFQLGVDPAAYKAALASKAGTIGQMFPASNKKLFLQKGASAVATLTKALGAATAGGGAAAVTAGTMAAAGTLATTLGIGLVAAGAAVKLIRMKGQKSSRAQLLQDLSKELQPFDVPEDLTGIDPTPGPVDPGPGPVDPGPEGPEYKKPDEPYEFPLIDIENEISKFVKDNGGDVDEGELEELVGKIEAWMQKNRQRGADYFDMDDSAFLGLKEQSEIEKGTGKYKGDDPGYKARRKYKGVKDPRIAIRKGGRSSRSMSLSRFLHKIFSIGNDQGRPEMFSKLNSKQLRKLKSIIVKMVFKDLEAQGAPIKQESQEDPLLERWSRIIGTKKVL